MKIVYLILGKPFAFSSLKVAKQFREEYTPYTQTKVGATTHLIIPDNRCKIVPTMEEVEVKVFDTIEECLKEYPHEKFFKYMNEVARAKSSAILKTPLVFDNHMKGSNRMIFKSYKLSYDIMQEILNSGRENLKNSQPEDPNTVVTTIKLNGTGKNTPVAQVTYKQFKEVEAALLKVNEKLEHLKEEYDVYYDDEEVEKE